MAGFHTKTFKVFDDYMTPLSAWQNIDHFIPKDKKVWDCFYGDAVSGSHMRSLGWDVIHKEMDFFQSNEGDILVSNPPYSMKKEVFTRLKEIDKPFVMICPSSMLTTKYIRELFSPDSAYRLQLIIPRKRIQFNKMGEVASGRCNFDCFYYCYKMDLPNDIVWLS
jgi:hypothetical protein